MDILIITIVIICIITNFYLIYNAIRSHIKLKQVERSFRSREHSIWLEKVGLLETSTEFNNWGQRMKEQAKKLGFNLTMTWI